MAIKDFSEFVVGNCVVYEYNDTDFRDKKRTQKYLAEITEKPALNAMFLSDITVLSQYGFLDRATYVFFDSKHIKILEYIDVPAREIKSKYPQYFI